MFAVLKTGGKQYKVAKGDTFTVEKLAANAGESVKFGEVLMIGGDKITVGAPFIKDAAVVAEIVEQTRAATTIHYVKRRRKHSSQRKKGHRQHLTMVRVTEILVSGAGKSAVAAAIGTAAARIVAHEAAVSKPKVEKKAKAVAKPSAEKLAKPAAEKVAKPVAEKAIKPAAEKAAKPAKKPAKKAE